MSTKFEITEAWNGAWLATIYADRYEPDAKSSNFYQGATLVAQLQLSSLVKITEVKDP